MSQKPTIHDIENAFQPAKEITAPEKFAGRENAISDCYYALITEGSNIAIVGNRGIGKTSLSRQLMLIGSGDNEVLNRLQLPVDGKLDFLTMYFACGDVIKNVNDLLERLLTSNDCLADWIYDIPKAKKEIEAYSPRFSVGITSLGGEKKTEKTSETAISQHKVDIIFTNVLRALVEQKLTKNGVLIVIDEFDRIDDPSGFASFIKALATNIPKVKICIVGVAQDIQQLMKEHESSDRLFAGSIIKLQPMQPPELTEIIKIAEASINNHIQFTEGARQKLVSLAQGHPYMVHLIGKYALRHAFQTNNKEINETDIDATLKAIAERGADPVLESRYKKAIAASSAREVVLKSLAEKIQDDGEVYTADAYKIALDSGVDNPSQYVGHLVTPEYGEEITKVRERYYRFKDSLFAAYVLARPYQFQ